MLVESIILASRLLPTAYPKPAPPKPPPLLPSHSSCLALPALPTHNPPFPIRMLCPAEQQARCDKSLCFNCDERFHMGHRFKSRPFLLLLSEDIIDDPNFPILPTTKTILAPFTHPDSPMPTILLTLSPPMNCPESPENFHLSLHAVSGHLSPRTLHFQDYIYGHGVSVLVDTGSSHNIIQPRIGSFLNLPTHDLPSFSVMVGNGAKLQCASYCSDVPLVANDHTFAVSLCVIPIQGADVVLGDQWLQTLGPFVSDYTVLAMATITQ